MICRRTSEIRLCFGENLWAEERRTAPEEDTDLLADCPAKGKNKVSMSMNIRKIDDFRME
jgi:hypothetical protein